MKNYSLQKTTDKDLFRVIDRKGNWKFYYDKISKQYLKGITTILDEGYNKPELLNWMKNHSKEEIEQKLQKAGARGELVSGQEPIISKTKERIKEIKEEATSDQKQIEVTPEEKSEKVTTFQDIENKFASILGDMTDKFMLYYAFIHALKPFYLDQRGEKKRRALIRFLQLTDSQERFLIENLTNAGLIERVGDLIFVTQKESALAVFNHYVDNGHLNLEEITRLFSQDES